MIFIFDGDLEFREKRASRHALKIIIKKRGRCLFLGLIF